MTTSHKGNGHPRRLVIVSNRLPFSVSMREGALHFNESTGGVVTGLGSFLGSMSPPFTSYLWVGWPGGTIEDSSKGELTGQAREKYRSLPVYLSEAEMENFYHGFCNKTIWPLFHYFPEFTVYKEEYWTQYRQVNEMFCDALIKELHEGDVIWIHDYHLMLLPKLVKARAPTLPVGFFLHIPFPSFELYRLLPEEWRKEILDGMLGADLVGFHTHEYTQHFLQSVLRLLGHENHMGQISLPSRVVRAETFPMGIDFQKFSSASARPEVMAEQKVVLPSLQGLKIILSVDRQDYSKGILNRLQAFEVFLEQNPQFHGKVVLIAIVVPSRIMVEHYEQMKRQIEECVGKINGKFGTINWTPIIYQYKQLTFEALSAMYTLSDVALVTPLRDGMNLIAKEYIASKADMSGVLILSEMAGAAQELSESIIINPNDRRAIARAMTEALEMPQEEQRRRMEVMRRRLRRYDVLRWSHDFLNQLLCTQDLQATLNAKLLREPYRRQIIEDYANGKRRLLLLDYDGTLTPIVRRPEHARPKPALLQLVNTLVGDRSNEVVLVSGRDRGTLQQWFGESGMNLVAEHGAWVKECDAEWKTLNPLVNGWKPQILPVLELYADRLPGAFVEEKEYSVAWHYRTADPEHSSVLARQLADYLTTFTANIDVQVLLGNKVIEVRNAGINKGVAAMHWLSGGKYDFVFSAGDDWTDEDMFNVLPADAHSIRVGVTSTRAKYNLHHSSDVLRLLEELIRVS